MSNRYAVILAAGQGTRMKSRLYKVLHPVCGKPMVQHVVDEVTQLEIDQVVTVIGHGAEKVKAYLGNKSEYVLQTEQLGTAHAVMQAAEQLAHKRGVTIIVCGDTPLIQSETMSQLFEHHERTGASATILTAQVTDPTGYGRIIRSSTGSVKKIVEQKDATVAERKITEINTGTYCFNNEELFAALENVSNENAQGEYYLPDAIEILGANGGVISAFQTSDHTETLGVNDRIALAEAERLMQKRINESHMRNGVTITDPTNTYIESNVHIGSDTIIYPGSVISGDTLIGSDCKIGPNSEIINCHVGNDTMITQSVVNDSKIGSSVSIGPFSHIRPQSVIGKNVRIGNFVEVKKSTFGEDSKASHLSYIGDAEVGKDVNIGCGSITVNYDGKDKHLTKIEDNVFIGCNSNLIAPVTVEAGAYVAAGSTITKDVPSEALAVARARQVNKENYVQKLNLKK